MRDSKERITLLAIGDESDFDSFMKFHRDKDSLIKYNIDYTHITYKELVKNKIPQIKTKSIIIFLFFPFNYWNKKIEPKNYKGIYGNRSFYDKFVNFFSLVEDRINKNFSNKQIFFVNSPFLSCKYRDKVLVKEVISNAGIATPNLVKDSDLKNIYNYLNRDKALFLKTRFGSMGKGMTFLSKSYWQTNFTFRNNKILSRKSDYGWKFKHITGNEAFLRKLLKNDIYIEEAVDSMSLDKAKFDLRIYTFFHKVIYIYPRTNEFEKITTNISQGGKGHSSRYIKKIPPHLISAAKKAASKTVEALGLNFAGVDVIIDKNLRDVYVFDVNVFPGFPKTQILDLPKRLIAHLGRLYLQRGLNCFRNNLKPFISVRPPGWRRRLVVFDYNSRFLPEVEKTILEYNSAHPDNSFSVDIYKSKECLFESEVGRADIILHSGGDGEPVKEDIEGVLKLYICHSHQWKAKKEGGHLTRLLRYHKGIKFIHVLEDDNILGKKGEMFIMKYSCLAVTRAPRYAQVLATSKALDRLGRQIEIIEALRYPNGSISIQGHPEEGTATHIIFNLLERVNTKNS